MYSAFRTISDQYSLIKQFKLDRRLCQPTDILEIVTKILIHNSFNKKTIALTILNISNSRSHSGMLPYVPLSVDA
jgi:hypothetical protein